MSELPYIPDSAPFTAEQRQWLNGFLAGMFSSQDGGGGPAAASTKGRVMLMFGSQSGNAEGLADEFAERLCAAGFDAPVVNMEDHEDFDLGAESHLLVISSTWGEGDPPDNAVAFWEALEAPDREPLSSLKFAVCGLGDSNYLDFCGMGKRFDTRLEALGATRLTDRVDCDVDYEEPAAEWFERVMQILDADGAASSGEVSTATGTPTTYSKKNPFPAPLLKNLKLNAEASERDTRHFELSLDGSGLSYEVGDALGVVPENCPEVAAELITALGFDQGATVEVPGGGEAPLEEAFCYSYAITIPPKKLLEHFRAQTGKAFDADYLWGREIIDLVQEHPELSFTPEEFVGLLGKLQPRLYSISSSPKAHEGEVHLTVAAVRYEAHGRTRKGVCSTFLADRCNGQGAKVFVHPAKGFKPPADPATKMIMVGPGTGIAPFRAFLEERRAVGAGGENWLLFGNPHRATDFLYQQELTSMIEQGTLHRFDAAWSRDGADKVYVQDKMRESADELWRWLDDGAHFYVCGDAKRMAKDVDAALHEAIATAGGKGEAGAAEYVAAMKKEKRYQRDVY